MQLLAIDMQQLSNQGQIDNELYFRNSIFRSRPAWFAIIYKQAFFLPLANREIQEYCLRFFLWKRWQRILIRFVLTISKLCKPLEFYPKVGFAVGCNTSCEAILPYALWTCESPGYISIKIGEIGPYQKTSILELTDAGIALSFKKVATVKSADCTIFREAEWLQILAAIPALQGSLPRLLRSGWLPNGRAFLEITISPILNTEPKFVSQHEHFLSMLGHATMEWSAYSDSREYHYMTKVLDRRQTVLGRDMHNELEVTWHKILEDLATWRGPMVLAHRDFTPWNVCCNKKDIFVFDWEFAAFGSNPLYDFFHFHLMPHVSSKWKCLAPFRVYALVSIALGYAQRIYPEGKWDKNVIKALLLAYLLNVILFYTESSNLFDSKHAVISSYLSIIRSHQQWI